MVIRTNPELWEHIKKLVKEAEIAGTKANQWSARKAQLCVKLYKANGGEYIEDNKPSSLTKWTAQNWRTKSGLPSSLTGERYLPEKAINALTNKEYEETSKVKKADMKKGIQYSKQPKAIAKITNAQLNGGLKAPFGRIGGKSKLKKLIVNSYFPDDYENMIYVEPFLGAGSIYFYKNPSKKEVINDLDETIYNLIKGFQKYDATKIKNDLDGEYNKEEFKKIKEWNPSNEYGKFIRNLILTKTSFFQKGTAYGVGNDGKRNVINSNFEGYKERLKDTTVLNKDYKEVIKKYDSPNTFFYLDPPYEHSEKFYENDTVPIAELYNLLSKIKGRFLISYNDSKEAKQLFKDYYIKYIYTTYVHTQYTGNRRKKEMLIANYKI